MWFAAHLYTRKLAHRTIKSYLAAVHYDQLCLRLGDPNIHQMPQLEYVMKGIKRSTAESTGTRLLVIPQMLRVMKRVWRGRGNQHDNKLLWAASCLCFFDYLRSGKVVMPSEGDYDPEVHLCYQDVRVDNYQNPGYLQVRLKESKTDPFRQGVNVYVRATHSELCPVAAVLSFMVARGN